jgi:hypothetical protein
VLEMQAVQRLGQLVVTVFFQQLPQKVEVAAEAISLLV